MRTLGRISIVGGWVVALVLAAAASAGAAGTCVAGSTPRMACPLTSTLSSSMPADNNRIYYKAWAHKGTEVRLTINDTEDPGCSIISSAVDHACSPVCVEFGFGGTDTPCSFPDHGLDRPVSTQTTAPRTGVFYFDVYLLTGSNSGGAIPYTLSVLANPAVRWPPPCVVPRLPHNTFLSVAKSRLRHSGCRVGRIRHRRTHRTHSGDVVSLGLHAGSVHRRGTKVAITVATR